MNKPHHNDRVRDKIRASQLVNRLQDSVLTKGKPLTSEQVRAATALLNKVLPDLRAVEHTGQLGVDAVVTHVTVELVAPK